MNREHILIKSCGRTASTTLQSYLGCIRSHWGLAHTIQYRGKGHGYDWKKIEKVVTVVRDPIDRFISERAFKPGKRLPDYTKSEDHMGLLMCEFRADVYRVPFKPPFTHVGMLGIVQWESFEEAMEPLCKWLDIVPDDPLKHLEAGDRDTPGKGPSQDELERWLTLEKIWGMRSTKFAKHFGY